MGNKIPNWKAGKLTGTYHTSLFDYSTKTIDGVDVSLSQYKTSGAVLVVNVASKCGLTKTHVPELRALNEKFGTDKFRILAFPCAQFAGQEFSDPEDTKKFFAALGAKFDVFECVEVNGAKTHPIFQYLKYNTPELRTEDSNGISLQAIGWNYGKFLVDKDGHVVKYYTPKTLPKHCEEDIVKVMNGELKGKPAIVPKANVSMGDAGADESAATSCSRM